MEKKYDNQKLFVVFTSRLREHNRPEIWMIPSNYNMKEYDVFELLNENVITGV